VFLFGSQRPEAIPHPWYVIHPLNLWMGFGLNPEMEAWNVPYRQSPVFGRRRSYRIILLSVYLKKVPLGVDLFGQLPLDMRLGADVLRKICV
jgi:hypothetical protein